MDPKTFAILIELTIAAYTVYQKLFAVYVDDSFKSIIGAASKIVKITAIVLATGFQIILLFFVLFWMAFFADYIIQLSFEDAPPLQSYLPESVLAFFVENPAAYIAIYLTFAFWIFCDFWHRTLYCFPFVMSVIVKIVTRSDDMTKFPKIIDYGYYFLGAIILFNLVLSTHEDPTPELWIIKVEILIALVFLSLKFTKVSLDIFPEKYLVNDISIRTRKGTTLFPISFPKN